MNQEKPRKKKRAAGKKTKPGPPEVVSIEFPPSPQSMEIPLAGIGDTARRKRRPVDEAQDLMYDAWEAPTRQRAIALAAKALAFSPDCADAYVLLAEETAETIPEAIELYRKGVEAGERTLGKKAFKEDVGYFWGLLKTRPYMRARAGLAQHLWKAGRREAAIEHFWEMLRLNPNDNQGIRDLLMPCLIELGRDKDGEILFRRFKEDGMAVWMYSRALLDFRRHGDSPTADKSLRNALDENRYVPVYILGRKKMPRNLPDHYGFGDDNEAVLYAYGNKAAWMATPGAIEWLAGKLK